MNMQIKVREYRTYTTTKTFEYILDVPDKETAGEIICECSYPRIGDTTEPSVPVEVEVDDEVYGRTAVIINDDGSDGEELYTWY